MGGGDCRPSQESLHKQVGFRESPLPRWCGLASVWVGGRTCGLGPLVALRPPSTETTTHAVSATAAPHPHTPPCLAPSKHRNHHTRSQRHRRTPPTHSPMPCPPPQKHRLAPRPPTPRQAHPVQQAAAHPRGDGRLVSAVRPPRTPAAPAPPGRRRPAGGLRGRGRGGGAAARRGRRFAAALLPPVYHAGAAPVQADGLRGRRVARAACPGGCRGWDKAASCAYWCRHECTT